MSEWFTYGSVRGAAGDGGPYRDSTSTASLSTRGATVASMWALNNNEPGSDRRNRWNVHSPGWARTTRCT